MASSPPPPDLLDDLDSPSPDLESSSSSLSSTQENSPLVGPILDPSVRSATIDAASRLLQDFADNFLRSVDDHVIRPSMQASRQPPSVVVSEDIIPPFQLTSDVNNPQQHQQQQQQPQTLQDHIELTPALPSSRKQKQKQKRSAPVQPPSTTSHTHNLNHQHYHHLHHHRRHDAFQQIDLFDSDTIFNRQGEEETFLRFHPAHHNAAVPGGPGPDISRRSNYANFYWGQDTFAISNVHHEEEEGGTGAVDVDDDDVEHDEDSEETDDHVAYGADPMGVDPMYGVGSSRMGTAARAHGTNGPNLTGAAMRVGNGAQMPPTPSGTKESNGMPIDDGCAAEHNDRTATGAKTRSVRPKNKNNKTKNSLQDHHQQPQQQLPAPSQLPAKKDRKGKRKAGAAVSAVTRRPTIPTHLERSGFGTGCSPAANLLHADPAAPPLPPFSFCISNTPKSNDRHYHHHHHSNTSTDPPPAPATTTTATTTTDFSSLFPVIISSQFDPEFGIPLLPDSAPKDPGRSCCSSPNQSIAADLEPYKNDYADKGNNEEVEDPAMLGMMKDQRGHFTNMEFPAMGTVSVKEG